MRTPHDMTWYERKVVDNKAEYTRHEIRGVNWQERKAANVIKAGFLEANKANIYVPFVQNGADRSEMLTFSIGDVLVKGTVTDEIGNDFSIDDLLSKYPHSVKVTSVDVKDYAIGQGSFHVQLGGA